MVQCAPWVCPDNLNCEKKLEMYMLRPDAVHERYGQRDDLLDPASFPCFDWRGTVHVGVIEGISESVVSVAKLGAGYLVDGIERRKPIVVAGYVVANAVKPLLALAQAW